MAVEDKAFTPGDRVDSKYLANRHELLAYGRIMKRKSGKFSILKNKFMKLTDSLHGKLRAVNLTLRRFELPRIQILFTSDKIKYHRFKQRVDIGSSGGKNGGKQSCNMDAQPQPCVYRRLNPDCSDDEEDFWCGNSVHDFPTEFWS